MEKQAFVDAGIDYDDGLNRFMGQEELFVKFLLKYLDDPSYRELVKGLEDRNAEEAFAAAHKMKGVVSFLSLKDLYDALVPVVEALRHATVVDDALALFPKLQEQYLRVTAFIRTIKA